MSILNKFTENLNREFNTKSSNTSSEYRMPAVVRDKDNSISMKKAMLISLIAHPLAVAILWLVITILALLGIQLTMLNKPKPHVNDIEFVLVDKEEKPKDANTKFRADKNSRTGGINDPKKPVSLPSAAPSKPANGGGGVAQKTPSKQPAAPKKQSFLNKITQSVAPSTKKPTPQKQTTTQKNVAPAPEVQQAVQKPQLAKPQPPTARPSIKPPMTPKPTQHPTNTPFKVPVPSGGTKTGQYSTGPISGSGSSSNGGSRGAGNYAPNPTFAPVGSGSGNKIASGAGSGSGKSGAGTGSGGSGYGRGTGAGGGNPGGGGGRPGIDAIREPDFGPYMRELQRKIKMNWEPPKGNESKRVVLLFKIAKDGKLLSVSVYKSSGLQNVDQAAINAVKVAAPFRALPPEYKGANIDIQFTFDYNVYGAKVR